MEQDHREKRYNAGRKKFKKINSVCSMLAVAIIGIAILSCGKSVVKELLLDKSRATMMVGETDKLYIMIQPQDIYPDLLWKSSDESVATVESGLVTGLKAGTVKISVTVKDQEDMTAVCEYVVDDHSVDIDTVAKAPVKTTPVQNTAPVQNAKPVTETPVKPSASGSKNLGYATFRGSWPNDINGRMDFKRTHVIDTKDPKGRMASPGDYVIGEWSDGHLVQGIWYGSDNQVKGSILIGK